MKRGKRQGHIGLQVLGWSSSLLLILGLAVALQCLPVKSSSGKERPLSPLETGFECHLCLVLSSLVTIVTGSLIAGYGYLRLQRQKIKVQKNLLELLILHTPGAIAIFDRQMHYLQVSQQWLEMYNLQETDIIGKSHYEVFPDIPQHWKDIHQYCLTGQIQECEEDPFYRADGSLDWVSWKIHPWYTYSGAVGGIILFTQVLTPYKKTTEQLREVEARWETLINSTSDGMMIVDQEGKVLFANPSAESILHKPLSELIDYPLGLPMVVGQTAEIEITHGGEVLGVSEISVAPVQWDGVEALVVSLRDISERRQAQLNLWERDERLQAIFDQAAVGIAFGLPSGQLVQVNQRYCQLSGYTEAELLTMTFRQLTHPEDLAIEEAYVQDLLSGNSQTYNLEKRYLRKDGQVQWVYLAVSIIRDWMGEPTQFIGIISDIQERKQMEVALQQANQEREKEIQRQLKQQAETERAVDTVVDKTRAFLDVDTIFSTVTYEARQLLKCDRTVVYRFNSDWSGQFVAESLGQDQRSFVKLPYAYQEFTEHLSDCFLKIQIKQNNISEIYVANDIFSRGFPSCYLRFFQRHQIRSYLIAPILQGDRFWGLLAAYQTAYPRSWKPWEIKAMIRLGKQLGIAIKQAESVHEIEQKSQQIIQALHAKAQMQQAKEAADAANQAKSEFLANMSHELRTPLNAILGFTQLLSRSAVASEQKEFLSIIKNSGSHLLSLINDILDLSKIESGKLSINRKDFDLYEMLLRLRKMFSIKAYQKGLIMEVHWAENVPKWIDGDEGRLSQVLINLLNNAIKFTSEGQVKLKVSKNSNNQRLCFEVEDTGPGIPAKERYRIFEPFVQTSLGRRSGEGTGLGLSISQKFVQLMGGKIYVSCPSSGGARFWFDLPFEEVEPTEVAPSPDPLPVIGLVPGQPTYRILIAEDVWEMRQLLVKLLSSVGFEVREACNGQEAVEVCESWKPHLIWIDMKISAIDGCSVIQMIRQSLGNHEIIIIGLMSHPVTDEGGDRSFECDDWIVKPFQESAIFETIAKYLGVRYLYGPIDSVSTLTNVHPSLPENLLEESNLKGIPEDWAIELYHCAAGADADGVYQLLAQLPEEYGAVKKAIASLVDRFCFDRIMKIAQCNFNHE
ncbi:PAS domain S-box protein [Roseofilum sp. BLCC_M154]|uniref:histidine kinase n=1 Tax=Roseofilum acuticapitatum BLCC-M154 TaxID=3022444 RepID=A0ABT7ASK5_9CYAN|nr:PAS domain S-box protein [Roseofilum acuticapitatum]MDJ1169281.1 PAS domain S-box protein [Roseofilum acuticapitatum BLCC-M154]